MLLHSMMSMSFGQTQRHDFGEQGKERCGIKHVKESVLLRPYFAYNTHKYGTIVFNLELPTYIRDKSSFRYSYQIRKVIISIPEQKKKNEKKSLIYSKLNLATVYMYIMYLDYLLTILKLSSRSAGDLRSFRTTPRYLVFFLQMLLYSPWLLSYLDLDYFELPTTFQTYIIFLWTGFLSLFQVLGLWEQWNKVSDNKGVSFSLFFIIYTFSTTCRMS